MISSRKDRSRDRKEAILDGALACFAEGGEAAVTIEEVGKRAPASVGSIYHHFGNKEGVLGALYDRALARYRASLDEDLARAGSAEEVVKALVRHHLAWIERHPDEARLLFRLRASAALAPRERELRQGTTEMLRSIKRRLADAIERGEVMRLPLSLYAPLITGPAHELARHWLAGRTPDVARLTDVAEPLAEAAWRSVRAE